MMRTLLVRGMLVGAVAGLLAFAFAEVFGEPSVDTAIAFETGLHQAASEVPEPELVSRGIQASLGLFTGVVLYGAAFGGLFALAFAFLYGRAGSGDPRALAAVLALVCFAAIALVPGLKYPPNPPSVGEPDTIRYRTALFFIMIAISLAAAVAAAATATRLARRYGAWNAWLAGAAVFLVIGLAAGLLLPAIDEVPERFPAVVLWRFRIASFGTEIVLWTTIGLLFGWLTARSPAFSGFSQRSYAVRRHGKAA